MTDKIGTFDTGNEWIVKKDTPMGQVNEVTIIIRGTRINNKLNYHFSRDLDTSKDYVGCVFCNKKYNIRRDCLYTYEPTGLLAIPRRLKGWTMRKRREWFHSKARPKYEYLCQFEEQYPEPVSHKDVSIPEPEDASNFYYKLKQSKIWSNGLNDFPNLSKGIPTWFIIGIAAIVIGVIVFVILNGQYHFIGGAPTPTPTPSKTNSTIIHSVLSLFGRI